MECNFVFALQEWYFQLDPVVVHLNFNFSVGILPLEQLFWHDCASHPGPCSVISLHKRALKAALLPSIRIATSLLSSIFNTKVGKVAMLGDLPARRSSIPPSCCSLRWHLASCLAFLTYQQDLESGHASKLEQMNTNRSVLLSKKGC